MRRVAHVICMKCGSMDHENAYTWEHLSPDRRCARPNPRTKRGLCLGRLMITLCPHDETNRDLVENDIAGMTVIPQSRPPFQVLVDYQMGERDEDEDNS